MTTGPPSGRSTGSPTTGSRSRSSTSSGAAGGGRGAGPGPARGGVRRPSGGGFPVEKLDIVGSDLQLVERVTGRLTKWRAAAAGAGGGLRAGLVIRVLVW